MWCYGYYPFRFRFYITSDSVLCTSGKIPHFVKEKFPSYLQLSDSPKSKFYMQNVSFYLLIEYIVITLFLHILMKREFGVRTWSRHYVKPGLDIFFCAILLHFHECYMKLCILSSQLLYSTMNINMCMSCLLL